MILCFRIDDSRFISLGVWEIFSTGAPNGFIVHMEFSRLPGDLGHVADSNNIPQNLTTTYHPVQIAIIQLMFPFFTRRVARSAIPLFSER